MIKLYKSEILDGERDSDASRRLINLCAAELCGAKNPTVLCTESGKPYFAELSVKFSVSHSGGRVILAVSDKEIGADIQKINPRAMRVAERFFTESECEYVGGEVQRFFEIWTKKEAYGKWLGGGFIAAKDVDVTALDFYTETDGEYVIAVYEND